MIEYEDAQLEVDQRIQDIFFNDEEENADIDDVVVLEETDNRRLFDFDKSSSEEENDSESEKEQRPRRSQRPRCPLKKQEEFFYKPQDCQQCINCRDKRKYGGGNKHKQKCLKPIEGGGVV